jgi:glycerol-3-phosphate dehydrogenase
MTFPVRAKAVVNAAGPWLDRVRRLGLPQPQPLIALIHLCCGPITIELPT